MSVPSAMKQGGSYNSSPKSTVTIPVPALTQSQDVKVIDTNQIKSNTNINSNTNMNVHSSTNTNGVYGTNGNSTNTNSTNSGTNTLKKESPREGTTKPPYGHNSPTSQSMPNQNTSHTNTTHTGPQSGPQSGTQGLVSTPTTTPLPTASSWDGLNGRDPSSPPALPKDFVFAQPQALPPRDGPRK